MIRRTTMGSQFAPRLLLIVAISGLVAACSSEFGTSRSQYSLEIDPPLTDVGVLPLGEWTSLSLQLTASGNDVEVARSYLAFSNYVTTSSGYDTNNEIQAEAVKLRRMADEIFEKHRILAQP